MSRRWCVVLVISCLSAGAGCSKPVRGWVPKPAVGQPYPNFSFVDDRGVSRSLSSLLGDYTVLIFTRCDKDSHGPIRSVLSEIVGMNRGQPLVHIVGIDVHHSEHRPAGDNRCHLIEAHGDVASICDSTGNLARLYGIEQGDGFYVIGPDRKLVYSAPAASAEHLKKWLQRDVSVLATQRDRERHPGER